MSQENVELVRSIYAAWECGDFSSAEWADPEIEYANAEGPLVGTWRGLEGMAQAMREFLRAWDDWRLTAEDSRELDAERVLVPFKFSGRGKTSGPELGQIRTEGASLFHVRDGSVTRLVQYFNRERALADLGLAPESEA